MITIFFKEINSFFNSLIAYMVIVVFLSFTGMFLWVIPDSSVLTFGYADITPFFQYAPIAFLLLIPAITMRTFSEEKKDGTIELLLTQPISEWSLIMGKYFASLALVLISLLPTLVYYASVYMLGKPVGNIDSAAVASSYLGLLLLAASLCSVGIFASLITKNQVIAFVTALVIGYVLLDGLGRLSTINVWGDMAYILTSISMDFRYQSLSKGMIDTRDLVYFLSIITLMLVFSKKILGSRTW